MKKIAAIVAVLVVVALAGFSIWQRTGSRASYSGAPESITFGGLVNDSNVVPFVAEERRFFAAQGIHFQSKIYRTGLETIEDVLNGKLDIAGAAEYPMVAKAFGKQPLSIIASVDKSYLVHLMGLTDRGIKSVADLKGKRIGLARGTIMEFYLGRFLTLNGLDIRDVTLVNVSPAQGTAAMAAGDVDAVVTWEPFASRLREQHANSTISWSVQSSQPVYIVYICRRDWLKQHPDLVRRFLTALTRAEGYIAQHPDEAKAILKKRYGYDDAYVERTWPENLFSVSLDQALITAMEDEARWMIANGLTAEKKVPDFLDYIYPDGLKAVKPDAVSIIGR